jgi:hypothetical protein
MTAGRIALVIIGVILGLVSLGLLAGGGVLVWEHATERDDDGYYTTRFERFQSDGYAVRTDDLDLEAEGADWLFEEGRLGTIRLSAVSLTPTPLFLGIGPRDAVEDYLDGVDHDVVTDFEVDPFRVEYEAQAGTRTPEPPGEQQFWVAFGERRIEWEVEGGEWVAVLMNGDGSPVVTAEVSAGAKTSLVVWAGGIALALGVLFGGLAALLIWLGLRRRGAPAAAQEPEAAAPAAEAPQAAAETPEAPEPPAEETPESPEPPAETPESPEPPAETPESPEPPGPENEAPRNPKP